MKILRQVKVVMLLALVFTIPLLAWIEAEAYMLPDTGQTLCYEYDSGTVVSCGTSGEDGQYIINPMSFTDNGSGTVTDNNTDLMWQKCSAGQTNDTDCSGTALTYNWYQATGTYHDSYNPSSQTICGALNSSNFAGYQDWRLPSALELQTIVDYSIASLSPSIMAASFPNTQVDYYWSTSTDPYHLSYAWHVHFGSGIVNRDSRSSSTNYVRCVRGAQTVQSFTDNGNDTVTDNKTGLIWE
jgi:hypothetical protein